MSHWQTALLVLAIAVGALLVGAHRSKRTAFSLYDILIDPATSRASLNAVILLVMATLSCWVVVDREMRGKDDVVEMLLGVLGVFVTGRVAASAIAAFKPQDVGSTTHEQTVRETTTTTPGP